MPASSKLPTACSLRASYKNLRGSFGILFSLPEMVMMERMSFILPKSISFNKRFSQSKLPTANHEAAYAAAAFPCPVNELGA